MTDPKWSESPAAKLTVEAKTDALWTRALDYVRGPRKFKIQAEGTWNYAPGCGCGPDGNAAEGFEDAHLHKAAARGCLIAKIGGCAGDTPASDKLHAVGSYAVFEITDGSGALYLGMNDKPQNWDRHSGSLTVTIWDAS